MIGRIKFRVVIYSMLCVSGLINAQTIGEPLPNWSEGMLDIHEISTGRGSSTFFMLPDGTSMIYDVGEFTETDQKWRIPRYVDAKPDTTKNSSVWITRYVQRLLRKASKKTIDYALLSHFHWDHMGQITSNSPVSLNGAYKLSGITAIGDKIRIGKIVDRDWPNYNYPKEQKSRTMKNYKAFLKWQIENNALQVEKLQPGSNSQITLLNKPDAYPTFEIRNIAANGTVWTGIGNGSRQHYPLLEDLKEEDYPTENMSSIAIRLSYGKFDYYTGGDLRGIPPVGNPDWNDLETPIARVVGPVEAAVVNHHGHIDSQNAYFVSALRPQVWLIPVWDSAHPGPNVYRRLQSEKLYPGPRAIFATNMHEANKLVLVGLDRLASDNGHIVIRVAPNGNTFKVIILDDNTETSKVKAVHGPFNCR